MPFRPCLGGQFTIMTPSVALFGGLEGYGPTGGGGGGGGTLASSVTDNQVTFTFSKPVYVGQFVTGGWWAVPPIGDTTVTITSITPNQTGTTTSTRNGWMSNPSSGAHPYDGRAAGFNAALQPTLPRACSPGESIVKCVSLAGSNGIGANVTYLDSVSILNVLATIPAVDAFRPPYYGTTKTIWRQSQLDTTKLPSKASVGSPPSIANVEERFSRPQLDHCYLTSPGGRPNPLQSFHAFGSPTTGHVYGENLAIDNCEAILRTFLNDSIATKQNMINYLVQAGIDWYGVANGGAQVAANGGGGHMGGRKIVVAYAGWLLGDTAIQNVAKETSGAGFGEKTQFYWNASAGGAGSHFTGQGAGMALFGIPNTFGKAFPYAGTGAKDIRDGQSGGLVDGGLSTDGPLTTSSPPLGSHPATVSATYNGGLYIDIGSAHAVLASTIIGLGGAALRAIFNYDTELFYADRLWDFGVWCSPDGGPGRALGTPVSNLHGTGSGGAVLSYGSSFGNAMRTTYYSPSLFTG